MSDAITYAQSRREVNPEKVGIWGSSYSGGHVLWVGAVDKRVKAVVTQLAMANGRDNANRLISSDAMPQLIAGFQAGNI
jgi:cephalosporin-C deacetylase-like acetyl esterase